MQTVSQEKVNAFSNKSVHSKRTNQPGAESALVSAGAHFVLCTPNKKPIWKRWPRRRPTAEVAALHRREHGPIGVIPWSLRSTGLDVDAGDPRQLLLAFGPWALIASRRRGGLHAYYDDTEPRGNSKWAALGCSGEVRGSKGYLILHNDGLELLAEALERRVEGARAWPRDLFEMAGLPPVAAREPMPFAEVREPELDRSPLIEVPLERVQVGGRGNALFDQVRLWAYQQSKGPGLIDWKARVLAYALRQNERFSIPFGRYPGDGGEVASTAWSISSWTWCGGGALDHGFVAQSRRGVAGAKVKRYLSYERDLEIVRRLDAGESQRAVARELGVSRWTVQTARARLSRARRAPKGVCMGGGGLST